MNTVTQCVDVLPKVFKEEYFVVDTDGLWEAYLGGFSDDVRQRYNCNACRKFIGRYGGMVSIDDQGSVHTALWDGNTSLEYHASFQAMKKLVENRKVKGVFITNKKVLGTPEKGGWSHLAVKDFPKRIDVTHRKISEMVSEKKHNFDVLMEALKLYTLKDVRTALSIVESGSLYRGGVVKDRLEFLQNILERRGGKKWHNFVWKESARLPSEFSRPRASMVGTLLDDIQDGLDWGSITRKFEAKMAGDAYLRPKAPPKAVHIGAAERIVEDLDIADSLERRFARVDEVPAIWVPMEKQKGGGVFSSLSTVEQLPLFSRNPTKMTWTVFHENFLHKANRIRVKAPNHGSYFGLTTAVHPNSKPIIRWDREDSRNPLAWYHWVNGASGNQFGLGTNDWSEALKIVESPEDSSNIFFVLKDAKETRQPSLCLFPEFLRRELHEVRAVLEAFSNKGKLQGLDDPERACGVSIHNEMKQMNLEMEVEFADYRQLITLDRWK
jgi:hypothetical protein